MSLKIKTAARLKALFAGVALSKKTIDLIGDQLAKTGLTDDSTDEEIDLKLNERNALHSFEDQKKFEDYQVGKASKEAADKEIKRLADIAAGKKPEDVELPADTPEWAKAFMKTQSEKAEALEAKIAAITGDKVTTTRRDQYAKALEGTSELFKAEALKDFDRLSFKDDTDYDEWLGAKSESAKGFIQDENNSALGGDRPAGGGGKTASTGKPTDAQVDALADAIL